MTCHLHGVKCLLVPARVHHNNNKCQILLATSKVSLYSCILWADKNSIMFPINRHRREASTSN